MTRRATTAIETDFVIVGAGVAAHKRITSRLLRALDNPERTHFELRSIHQVAARFSYAAMDREESRGGHYRTDFPSKSPAFERHSLIACPLDAPDARLVF